MIRPQKCPFCGAAVEGDGPVCRQCGFDLDSDWTPASEEEKRAAFDPGRRACPACGALNAVGVDFCAECNAPVGDYVASKPFEQIWARGYVYRRAIQGQQVLHPAARTGRALLGVMFLITAAFPMPLLVWEHAVSERESVGAVVCGALVSLLLFWVVLRLLRSRLGVNPRAGRVPLIPVVLGIGALAALLLSGWTGWTLELTVMTVIVSALSVLMLWVGLGLLGVRCCTGGADQNPPADGEAQEQK